MVDGASDVHDFALVATADTLREALTNRAGRSSDPESVALRAISSAFHSDVPGAIAVLRRALSACSNATDAVYLRDLLAQWLVSTGDILSLERVLRDCGEVPERLAPAMIGMNAILLAMRGDVAGSRQLTQKSLMSSERLDTPRSRGRVLCRCSLAAYYRGDFDESRDLALRAARLLESDGAHWSAAAAYSVAGSIAQDWNQDGGIASAHYSRMLHGAEEAGHTALRRTALAACFHVAAETFDEAAHTAIRRKLVEQPQPQQHQENYVLVIAEALGFGWKAEFARAEAVLTAACAPEPMLSQPQRAMLEALLALIAAANSNLELARSLSRSALKRTARSAQEPLFAHRAREQARLLSAATCFIIGDIVRGQRALAGRYDADHRYRGLLLSEPIDLGQCPELFRGYAHFINVAAARARAARPDCRLTRTEADVLAALPQGSTLAELALELNKSKHTIARQIESIYQKLGVRNRAQAIEKARGAGLIR